MTDSKHHDLRTRIAAAIMESCHGVFVDDAVNGADAVISELGLKKEWLERPHSEERDIRWVTDWMPDA